MVSLVVYLYAARIENRIKGHFYMGLIGQMAILTSCTADHERDWPVESTSLELASNQNIMLNARNNVSVADLRYFFPSFLIAADPTQSSTANHFDFRGPTGWLVRGSSYCPVVVLTLRTFA